MSKFKNIGFIVLAVLFLSATKSVAQVTTLTAKKPISAKDAKAIQEILNDSKSTGISLSTVNNKGEKFVYNRKNVVGGKKIVNLKDFGNRSVVHSTLKDFFFKTNSPAEIEKLNTLKGILAKYN